MSEADDYILNAIKTWVWSGFYSPSDVDQMIGDILEDGADEMSLRAAVRPEFARKPRLRHRGPRKPIATGITLYGPRTRQRTWQRWAG